MKFLLPLTVAGLLLSTAAVHPQPYDPYGPDDLGPPPPPPHDFAPPPPRPPGPRPPGPRPLARMICVIASPVTFVHRSCPTRPGYPGSPCRCAGSVFEGTRDDMY